MELDDLKHSWVKEKMELEERIAINEKFINEMRLDKSKGSFDKMLSTAILGRNLALVYMAISISVGIEYIRELVYSVPAFIGAAAMLFSFFQHRWLKRLDFSKMNTVELQKALCLFRIHTLRHSKYDTSIVCLWVLTLTPILLKGLAIWYSAVLLVSVLVALILYAKYIYNKWDGQLKEHEMELGKIIEFEGN